MCVELGFSLLFTSHCISSLMVIVVCCVFSLMLKRISDGFIRLVTNLLKSSEETSSLSSAIVCF